MKCVLCSKNKSVYNRAVSGISGSRIPDNRLRYPNPNFGSGARNVALREESKDYPMKDYPMNDIFRVV